ncbi:uncharacterized protein LOC144462832 [Epinephelus lanceolatus]
MGSAIRTFFHRDDVSTIVNGKAGEIRRSGQVFRRRFLCDTIENLHKRFLMENPSRKIFRAQFFKCRPFWISSPTLLDRETCACKIHENFEGKIKKLHQLGNAGVSSCLGVVDFVVCEKGNMDCMYRRCKDCKSKSFSPMLDPNTKDNIVQWKEWVSRSTPIIKKRENGSTVEIEVKTTSLEKCSASIEKLVSLTEESLPCFCKHTYNIKHQFEHIQILMSNLQEDEAVVHVDYSENYNCKWNKEIQEVHFGGSHRQVTLHTGVLYLSGGRLESFASVTDCLRHDAAATWAHLDPVLEHLRSHYPAVTKFHFLSDGPTPQYRNKTAFYLASTVPFLKGFSYITWNFTEASHGKGAPDGVGGALKNLADRIVARGTDILDMRALITNLKQHSGVRIFEITEEEILKSSELVPPSLKPVPGTMSVHQLIAKEAGCIRVRDVSCFCKSWCDCFSPRELRFSCSHNSGAEKEEGDTDARAIEVGTWVLVNYDGDLFPGIVTQIVAEQYKVDTMYRAGPNRFFIPTVKIPGDKVCCQNVNVSYVMSC